MVLLSVLAGCSHAALRAQAVHSRFYQFIKKFHRSYLVSCDAIANRFGFLSAFFTAENPFLHDLQRLCCSQLVNDSQWMSTSDFLLCKKGCRAGSSFSSCISFPLACIYPTSTPFESLDTEYINIVQFTLFIFVQNINNFPTLIVIINKSSFSSLCTSSKFKISFDTLFAR